MKRICASLDHVWWNSDDRESAQGHVAILNKPSCSTRGSPQGSFFENSSPKRPKVATIFNRPNHQDLHPNFKLKTAEWSAALGSLDPSVNEAVVLHGTSPELLPQILGNGVSATE